jgi:hypothetical protein
MFKVTVAGKPLKVVFHHDASGTKCVVFPDATISETDTRYPPPIGYGQSTRVATDNPCRKIGRKYALKHCLENLGLDKETRTAIWSAYKEKTRV